jgi:hypothetical protein
LYQVATAKTERVWMRVTLVLIGGMNFKDNDLCVEMQLKIRSVLYPVVF